MNQVEQQSFFKRSTLRRRSQFQYLKVRAFLAKKLTKKKVKQRMLDVGGTYQPLSVYYHREHDLPPNFYELVPSQWSDLLQQCVYLLPEVTVQERYLQEIAEFHILQSERSIKKIKGVVDNSGAPADFAAA